MRGIYLQYNKIDPDRVSTGIDSKILLQVSEMSKNDLNCEYYSLKSKFNLINKILYRLPFTNSLIKWTYDNSFENIDFVYFRRPGCINDSTIKFLRKVRKFNPKIKLIMEIPTYPYDKEFTVKKRDVPLLLIDKINRRKLKGLIDRIVTFSNDIEIFGVETIQMINGIDFNLISQKSKTNNSASINFIAVSSMEDWHGYDRFIKGLYTYVKQGGKQKIKLSLVGEGTKYEYYKELVKRYKLNDLVFFHGIKNGSALDQLYEEADIAIETLGCHRKDLYLSSSLKSREYLGKGIPFLGSCEIDVIPPNWKYFLKVDSDESEVDINELISFVKNLKESDVDHSNIIRSFGEQNCDISLTFKPVIDYLKN